MLNQWKYFASSKNASMLLLKNNDTRNWNVGAGGGSGPKLQINKITCHESQTFNVGNHVQIEENKNSLYHYFFF